MTPTTSHTNQKPIATLSIQLTPEESERLYRMAKAVGMTSNACARSLLANADTVMVGQICVRLSDDGEVLEVTQP